MNNPFGIIKSFFSNNLLKNPGDSLSAKVTDTNRQVIKLKIGKEKYSATKYPNGTVVETKTTRGNK